MIRKTTTHFLMYMAALALLILCNYEGLILKREKESKEEAFVIKKTLSESFEQTEKMLVFVGMKIANENPNLNLNSIHKTFITYSAVVDSSIFSWSLFDWVNSDNMQTVNTMFGVNDKDPRDMSDRFYSLRNLEQWSLLFSNPVVGSPSQILVIPVGVQIATKTNPRAGTVVLGLHVNKLRSLIEAQISRSNRFILVDKRSEEVVFGSESTMQSGKVNVNNPSSLSSGKNSYVYSLDMDTKYPYTIVVGYDREEFWADVLFNSFMSFLQIAIISLLMIDIKKKKSR